jgi:hypothetical protein
MHEKRYEHVSMMILFIALFKITLAAECYAMGCNLLAAKVLERGQKRSAMLLRLFLGFWLWTGKTTVTIIMDDGTTMPGGQVSNARKKHPLKLHI